VRQFVAPQEKMEDMCQYICHFGDLLVMQHGAYGLSGCKLNNVQCVL
jgi:hypothetical protein